MEKHDESDEKTGEYEESEPPPTCSTVLDFAEKFQTVLDARDVSDDILEMMSFLEKTIAQQRDWKRVQSKINYYKYVD